MIVLIFELFITKIEALFKNSTLKTAKANDRERKAYEKEIYKHIDKLGLK